MKRAIGLEHLTLLDIAPPEFVSLAGMLVSVEAPSAAALAAGSPGEYAGPDAPSARWSAD